MRPSIGRIVHLVQNGHCHAAIITHVADYPAGPGPLPEEDKDNIAVPVGLHVFFPKGGIASWGDPDRAGVMQSEDGREQGTWHWPERV